MSVPSQEIRVSPKNVWMCSVWKSDMKTGLNGALVGALGAPLPPFCRENRSGSNGTAPGPPPKYKQIDKLPIYRPPAADMLFGTIY